MAKLKYISQEDFEEIKSHTRVEKLVSAYKVALVKAKSEPSKKEYYHEFAEVCLARIEQVKKEEEDKKELEAKEAAEAEERQLQMENESSDDIIPQEEGEAS